MLALVLFSLLADSLQFLELVRIVTVEGEAGLEHIAVHLGVIQQGADNILHEHLIKVLCVLHDLGVQR